MPGQRDEDFHPTSGRPLGLLGLAVVLVAVAGTVLDPTLRMPAWGWPAAVLAAVLLWAAMLRPRVWVGDGSLVLRTMFETVHVPLAAVETVTVRQVLVVTAGGRRWTCPALGRPRRALVRADRGGGGHGSGIGSVFGLGGSYRGGSAEPAPRAMGVDYPAYVESRLLELTSRGRLEARVRPGSAEQAALARGVRREPDPRARYRGLARRQARHRGARQQRARPGQPALLRGLRGRLLSDPGGHAL